jgi:hypothetical protein
MRTAAQRAERYSEVWADAVGGRTRHLPFLSGASPESIISEKRTAIRHTPGLKQHQSLEGKVLTSCLCILHKYAKQAIGSKSP